MAYRLHQWRNNVAPTREASDPLRDSEDQRCTDPDRLISYPDPHNLSVWQQPIHVSSRRRHRWTMSEGNALDSAALHEQLDSAMPPQVVQYPQPTSSTAHSSRAADVEGGQRFNLFGNVQPDREDSTRSEGVDSSRSGVRLTATSIFVNAGAKKPLATSTGDGRATATQKSHIISHGHFWRQPTNVAMTTMRIHDMKEPQPNYVQHSSHTGAEASAWLAGPAGSGRTTSRRASTPGPTGVEGAGGTGGHGRASRRGAEQSEDA